MKDLKQELKNWDGKSASDLEFVFNDHQSNPSFVSTLISYLKEVEVQSAASWLVKRYLEVNGNFTHSQNDALFKYLMVFEHWSTRLHFLQCLPYIKIPVSHKESVVVFLRNNLTDTNKFVRAWAYHGFYELSLQYPEYKDETKSFFEMALRDEAASVKARIRNILKAGF